MQPTILAIIGKPLAGKDTQADLLVTAHENAVKISTGHIIRAVREEGETHRFWPLIGPYIEMEKHGVKLPDPEIMNMLGTIIREQVSDGKKLLVIAGSPRSLDQLEGFMSISKDVNANLLIAHLDTTDSQTYARSANRNEGRIDDTPEVHAVRLEEYRTHVEPVVDKLQKENHIIEIDGMKSKEVVFSMLEREVNRRMFDPEITLPAMARR
ncbi:MAG: nucleoside monophosphate kinase [Patescibacteria group bacterium]